MKTINVANGAVLVNDGYKQAAYPLASINLYEVRDELFVENNAGVVLHRGALTEWNGGTDFDSILALGVLQTEENRYSDLNGMPFPIKVSNFQANTTGARDAVIGFRLQNEATGVVKLKNVLGFIGTNDDTEFEIIKSPDNITNPQPFVADGSKLEFSLGLGGNAVSGTIAIGGTALFSKPVESSLQIDMETEIFLEQGITYYLIAQPLGGNADIFLTLNRYEYES